MNGGRLCLLDGMESVLSHKGQERQEWELGWFKATKDRRNRRVELGWFDPQRTGETGVR